VDGRLGGELDRLPLLRPVGRRDQVEHRAAVLAVVRVPIGADGQLALAVGVDVLCREANVVALREVLGDDEFLPRRVAVPGELRLVGQENVGLAVAVDIRDGTP
jgi:hypothetical protein